MLVGCSSAEPAGCGSALPSLAHEGWNLQIVSVVGDVHTAADGLNRRRLLADWLRRLVLHWLGVAHDLGDVLEVVGNVRNRARTLCGLMRLRLRRSHRLRLGRRRLLRLEHGRYFVGRVHACCCNTNVMGHIGHWTGMLARTRKVFKF